MITQNYAEVGWSVGDVIGIAKESGVNMSQNEAAKILKDNEDEIQLEQIRVGTNVIRNIISHLKK